MDQQATRDGLRVSFTQVLNEAVFSKNVLLQYGGYSPYEALFGRTPPMLDVMTAEDDQEREHPARLRSIAVQAMIQASAEDRIRRANATKSRPAGELKDMQVGDLVDIYRPTISKDVPRWHGPASITDLTALTDGIIGVRWQGRNLQVRVQDARRALAFAYAPAFFGGANSPIEVLKVAAESFKGCMRVGWFRKNDRWLPCEGNKEYSEVLHAGLHVGAVNLQLIGVFSLRFGHGMKTISGKKDVKGRLVAQGFQDRQSLSTFAGDKDGPKIGNNPIQILEFVSKKQSRVCRSTFTAELYAALDLVALANTINLAMTEVLTGSKSASMMADIQETGTNALESDLFLDARAVFDCIVATDTKTTTDKLMLVHALKLKEILAMRVASRLCWIDTLDMLSDGLNKGSVARDPIRNACVHGQWKILHEFKQHVEARTCLYNHLLGRSFRSTSANSIAMEPSANFRRCSAEQKGKHAALDRQVFVRDGAAVDKAWKKFDGFDRWALPTAKVCQVGWSGPHQGFQAHVERYRNSPVMHKSVPDCYKPMIFKNGIRKPFPRPTKKVKESTCVTDHSDVETLESCANVVVKGSFLDLDDQCLMRQYRKLRRVMSDSILVGVLDVPEVYEPGRFSNDVEKARPKAQQTPPEQEKTPAATQPKTSRSQVTGKAAKDEESCRKVQRTTVMLRNLPNNYTRDMFLSLLDEEGLSELYDFVYLPMDFCRDANLGYAFVNLVDGAAVGKAWKKFDGFDRWALPTAKVCQVGWSGPHQGFQAHVERYRNSPVMHKSVPDCYKPMIFKNGIHQAALCDVVSARKRYHWVPGLLCLSPIHFLAMSPQSLAKSMSVHSNTESTCVTDHSDVETLESCSSRPLSPCQTCTAEMEGETGANVVVKGSFLDLDDQCLMRQYRKLRRVMSDSILVGVLDVPEVYEPGRFSNDVEKARPKAQQTPPEQEKTPAATQPKTSRSQVTGKAAKDEESCRKVQRTTVMLRNLPNNYTRDMFLSLLDEEGLSELYDFVYLPMDFCRDANLGYAFVNLVDGAAVDKAWKKFDGFDRWALPTAKVGPKFAKSSMTQGWYVKWVGAVHIKAFKPMLSDIATVLLCTRVCQTVTSP
ncbi:unnamed protein product [Cladocopium goreaui]|uniref:Protein MEI2-like 3 (AML3) (MEI2-like protein 3) n=1 Tax=Cladocopium goreaui TaxID=2562237 RepID=A0A9P1FQS8_9DINO|nr:unnamed protein product [Cladocopium goreaui]